MTVGIVVFPGSNCDRDCYDAASQYMQVPTKYLWHDDTDVTGISAILLPGGFSYGDYLRAGAIARFSPMMVSVKQFADNGGPVLGICNGFQILTESGLLPGALVRNDSLRFICDRVTVTVERSDTVFTSQILPGTTLELPIAHAEGNYIAEPETIERIEAGGQVIFRYTEPVNGSVNNIAGICSEKRNVVGLMPHPERNLWPSESWKGDGRGVFDSLKLALAGHQLATA